MKTKDVVYHFTLMSFVCSSCVLQTNFTNANPSSPSSKPTYSSTQKKVNESDHNTSTTPKIKMTTTPNVSLTKTSSMVTATPNTSLATMATMPTTRAPNTLATTPLLSTTIPNASHTTATPASSSTSSLNNRDIMYCSIIGILSAFVAILLIVVLKRRCKTRNDLTCQCGHHSGTLSNYSLKNVDVEDRVAPENLTPNSGYQFLTSGKPRCLSVVHAYEDIMVFNDSQHQHEESDTAL
ncbi:uncharacterized protein LOC134177457 [Corticium candelabrum]|uniref:uncharacterized protein LOC134177457 n=1 Tax=Corticium candelabrum TaxID=121492 RepID=UPI002E25A5FF|nr:uncharacterized protein LOC134177457 [Corticium candelabrum]